MESEAVPSPITSELRSKSNKDRDSAREGLTLSRKRPLPPSSGENNSKLPALSPSHGKVAPLKPKKTLITLGGRRANPLGDVADASKPKSVETGSAKAAFITVAPRKSALKTAHK